MAVFASAEWIAELDAALSGVAASGPPLRVRYHFVDGDGPGAALCYDLVFGNGVRAEPSAGEATVTITQPLSVARAVASGQLGAQHAVLEGSITVAGNVTELLAWADALGAIDRAMAALRSHTQWS